MNRIAKEIRDYWDDQLPCFQWDSEILDLVSRTLTPEETEVLTKGRDACQAAEGKTWEQYLFTITKAFNRHNDIVCHYTTVGPGETLLCTSRSSITELNINISTLVNCNRNCVYHINDIEKTMLPRLTLESIADVTAAIIVYNAIHQNDVGR